MQPIIRLAAEPDAASVAAIYAPSVLNSPVSFEIEPPMAAEMGERIRGTLAQMPWLVCERDGEILGYVYAAPHRARAAYRWSVDVAVYIHPDCRRSGVGRALYTSLFGLLRLQGYCNAYAGITLPNPGSVGLHEALGFKPVGVYRQVGYKADRWHDVGWWGLALQEHSSPPTDPVPLSTIRERDVFVDRLAEGLPLLRL